MREKLKWKASIDGYFLHMIDGDSNDFTWFIYVKKKEIKLVNETSNDTYFTLLWIVNQEIHIKNNYKQLVIQTTD